MIKPPMSNIPGMSAMTDTLGFVKNLWGGMGVPGMVMPTLSVDEINKQISDLKAVESWLNLNMNMLRGTIQALEVQAATISTLQSMGETLAAAAQSGSAMKDKPAPSRSEPQREPMSGAAQPAASKAKSESAEPLAAPGAPQANPAVWWNMLQDQFKQAVNSAMAADPGKALAKFNPKSAAPNGAEKAAKSAPRKSSKSAPHKSGTRTASKE